MFLRLTLLITFLLAGPVTAQEGFLRFKHLMDRDDLSSNSVLSICQDYRGFMWFGTRDGLNRYDGYEFRIYYNIAGDSASLSDNHVNIVFEDSRKNLWIGTAAGLNRFNREKDEFVRFLQGQDSNSISNAFVKTLNEDSQGNIWVGTAGGINKISAKSGKISQFTDAPGQLNQPEAFNVESIFEDREGYLWIGSRNGLYRYKEDSFEPFHLNIPGSDKATVWARMITEDPQGNVWIATEYNGVLMLDRTTDDLTQYIHEEGNRNSLINNMVRTICEDENGRIWFGTREGLSILNLQTNQFQNYEHNRYDPTSLSHNSIRAVVSDNSHGIWIATYAGGLNYYHPNNGVFIHITEEFGTSNTLSYNKISCLFKDREGILWIGTEGRGLNRYDENRGKFHHFINSESEQYSSLDNIKSIIDAGDGTLWLGTYGGLARFDKKKKKFTNFIHDPSDTNSLIFNQVHATIIDSSGNLWVGTNGGGLDLYDPGLNGFIHHTHNDDPFSIISNNINVMVEDTHGKLWVGTHAGLESYDPVTDRFSEFPDGSGRRRILSGTRILALLIDRHGRFWIGTEGKGLILFNRRDYSFRDVTKNDGLPNNVVNAITEDEESNLWISTNRGISRLSFENDLGDGETGVSIRNFNESEGLQGLQFYPGSAYRSRDGRLYFGGINGYNVFLPKDISDTLITPPVVFTDFKIKYVSAMIDEKGSPLTKDISETENVTLNYFQREFSVTFAGLNYLDPGNTFYSYRMEGMDDRWNYLGTQRTITFAYLKPGDYTLRVRASDNPGSWGKDSSSLTNELPRGRAPRYQKRVSCPSYIFS